MTLAYVSCGSNCFDELPPTNNRVCGVSKEHRLISPGRQGEDQDQDQDKEQGCADSAESRLFPIRWIMAHLR